MSAGCARQAITVELTITPSFAEHAARDEAELWRWLQVPYELLSHAHCLPAAMDWRCTPADGALQLS